MTHHFLIEKKSGQKEDPPPSKHKKMILERYKWRNIKLVASLKLFFTSFKLGHAIIKRSVMLPSKPKHNIC
jgi:hypothetical protein